MNIKKIKKLEFNQKQGSGNDLNCYNHLEKSLSSQCWGKLNMNTPYDSAVPFLNTYAIV